MILILDLSIGNLKWLWLVWLLKKSGWKSRQLSLKDEEYQKRWKYEKSNRNAKNHDITVGVFDGPISQ